MKQQLRALSCAISLALLFLGPYAHARGRGGRGFSREGPAAGGGFASRAEGMRGLGERGGFASRFEGMRGGEAGFQSNRQQYAAGAQAGRQQYGAQAQGSRQQEANTLQSSREQTAQRMQSSAQQYRGSYPYGAAAYPAWDAGAGVAAATMGAAIGTAAAASSMASPSMASPSSAGAGYAAGLPCASPQVVPVGEMQFYRCGSSWYRQAYGPAGPIFVAIRRPGF